MESHQAREYPYPIHLREKGNDDDASTDDLRESIPREPARDSVKNPTPDPVPAPAVAQSVAALMSQLTRLFQEQDLQREKNQRQQTDRKQRREIDEKKQAMGIRG